MNIITGGWRIGERRKQLARQAAADLGAAHLDEWSGSGDQWVASASDGGAAVARVERDGEVRAAYGSGVRALAGPGGPGDGLDDDGDGHGGLLDGADDDLVAVTGDDVGLVAAGGRGNHRLFETTFPEGGSMVSSHLGLLARVRDDDLRVDRSYEDFLLGFGFLPDGRTPFTDVRVLEPGTRRRLGDPGVETVAPPPVPPRADTPPSFDDAADELYERFSAAIDDQAGTDQRHAVLLGGFDSALVAAALRRLGHEVHTFTFGFEDARYEQRGAEEVSRHIGAEHTWVKITPDAVMDVLARFSDVFPQPGPQPHYQVHTLLASELIRQQGFTHVFSGDGCDAVFLGYPMVNTRARIIQGLRRTPAPVVRTALGALGTRAADRHLGHVARMGRSTLRSLLLPEPARGHLPTCYLDERALARVRDDAPPVQAETVGDIRLRLAEAVRELDSVRLAFNGMALTGQSRTKVDGAVAATGVVQRSPFLHPGLRSFITGLPTDYLRPPGMRAGAAGKALLVETVRRHRLLPDWVVDMPKQSPVDSPIDAWLSGPLREDVFRLLDRLPFAYDRAYVDELMLSRRVEDLYRERVSLGHQAFQAIGLLCSYAAFTSLAHG
jgi:asparagine synthase